MSELEKIVAHNCPNRNGYIQPKDTNSKVPEPKKSVQWSDETTTKPESYRQNQSEEKRLQRDEKNDEKQPQNNEKRPQNSETAPAKNANRDVRRPVTKVSRVRPGSRNENECGDTSKKTDSEKAEISDPIRDFVNQLVNKGKINSEVNNISAKTSVSDVLMSSGRAEDNMQNSVAIRRGKRKPKSWNQKRVSKVTRTRQLNTIQRMKTKSGTPSPSKNARRRKGDVTKSMEDDFMELDSASGEQKLSKDADRGQTVEEGKIKANASFVGDTVPEKTTRDPSDGFRIEIGRTPLEDDMKPHTFNLIPASRRLKLLQKRAQLCAEESEVPAKKQCAGSEVTLLHYFTPVCSYQSPAPLPT